MAPVRAAPPIGYAAPATGEDAEVAQPARLAQRRRGMTELRDSRPNSLPVWLRGGDVINCTRVSLEHSR
jgi:hypothetical protein